MDNFLSGVKSFTGGESSGVGGAAQPAQAAGGTDWSQLSTLASHFGGAQQEHGDSLDINKFTSFLGKQSGTSAADPAEAAQQAGADPSVINKLLGFYQQHTGKTMEPGGGGSFDELEAVAAKQLGINVPVPVLKQMVKWKLNGTF